MQGALRFTLDETLAPLSPFQWLDGIYEFNADMIANSEMTDTAREERSKLREAKDFLRQMLAGGGMEVGECRRQAERAGITPSTLLRAKDDLGVVARQSGFGATKAWWWSLPSVEKGALS